MSKWETKCWGRVWHRFNDEIINESLLEVNKGYQCSIHWHNDRWNCFISIDATIGIETFGPSTSVPRFNDQIIIKPGESHIIPPRIWHRFYILEPGKIIEVYWTTNGSICNVNDINRLDVGGKRI